MKLINKLFTLALCLMITLLCSCSKEEDNVARAVLSSTSSLNFPAQKPTEKMITVYSDAEWFMEELPEWITVTPTTGSGTTEVTISVSENLPCPSKTFGAYILYFFLNSFNPLLNSSTLSLYPIFNTS